ncbi:hypothetical protein [Roseivivax sp. THAF30]|uniref:hypothetical protein n=1 Tax=Roseivivax sp. THAF30 TaxID=2587852 RepID=UPI001269595D|nr:hypothetical protein [Roseivivax sp. THAF30]QFT61571.1 hypothetical protein FIU91_01415 [Roseivivax sp. THAF30]
MGIAQLSRGLLLSVILGMLFTFWVNPGTTGGLLLLLTVSTGVIYLIVSMIHLILLTLRKGRSTASEQVENAPAERAQATGATFVSRRSETSDTE